MKLVGTMLFTATMVMFVAGATLAAPATDKPAMPADKPAAAATDKAAAGLEAKKPGEKLTLGGKEVTVKEMTVLPLVKNEFSDVYKFDSYENPKLKTLREKYELDKVVAKGKDEFDKQVLLMDWTMNRFKKFNQPTCPARGALEVLAAIDQGNAFFCSQHTEVLVSSAAAMGWVVRPISLRVGKAGAGGGDNAIEHSISEIWSNQYGKWIMFDPTFALYVEKDGVPLNAYEIRQEWFYNGNGKDLTFVIGADRKKYHRADLPILRGNFAGFGPLKLATGTFNKYAFLAYIPNNNLMDAGEDYGNMFIIKDDAQCAGVKWHVRKGPKDPAHEPYFPIDQAALTLTPGEGLTVQVAASTNTPNFSGYKSRIDGKAWQGAAPTEWKLHEGANTLEVVAINKFNVEGPPSKVVLEVK